VLPVARALWAWRRAKVLNHARAGFIRVERVPRWSGRNQTAASAEASLLGAAVDTARFGRLGGHARGSAMWSGTKVPDLTLTIRFSSAASSADLTWMGPPFMPTSPRSAPSVSGRVLQPIPGCSPHQTPEFSVHFLLIPPRRVPTDSTALIELHQVASMKNLRQQPVHFAAAFP
jgi:hypothetical protein